jgi:hypothetical protein
MIQHDMTCRSKVCAERRAWELAAQQKQQQQHSQKGGGWDLVTIHPALVLGPVTTPRSDGESVDMMARISRVGAKHTACTHT